MCQIQLLEKQLEKEREKSIIAEQEYTKKIEKLSQKVNQLQQKDSKFQPKDKREVNLAKYYIKIAKQIGDKPSVRDLESSIFKKSSWNKLLNDLPFVVKLIFLIKSEIDKPSNLKHKDLLIKVCKELENDLPEIQLKTKKIEDNPREIIDPSDNYYE